MLFLFTTVLPGLRTQTTNLQITLIRPINHSLLRIILDIPIETNKDGEASITELLGCVEKTVRNRRDRAFAKIRQALELEVFV